MTVTFSITDPSEVKHEHAGSTFENYDKWYSMKVIITVTEGPLQGTYVVGELSYYREKGTGPYIIDNIHVDDSFQRMGIATKMIRKLELLADYSNTVIYTTFRTRKGKKFFSKFPSIKLRKGAMG